MATQVLGIDLHDAGRDGLYGVDPDDPGTLVDDAARAGLPVIRIDLSQCSDAAMLLAGIAAAGQLPASAGASWDALDAALRAGGNAGTHGHVLLFDHADALFRKAPALYAEACKHLKAMARGWHGRGVPFFVFMTFPDNETRDAAIDA